MAHGRRRLLVVVAVLAALAVILWHRAHREPGPRGTGARTSPAGAPIGWRTAARTGDARGLGRAVISGRITSAGAGVAGAMVCGLARSPDLSDAETRDPSCTSSDAGGGYRLAGLLPARYSVSASAPSLRPAAWRRGTLHEVDVGPGEERSGIDIDLRPGGVLATGVVKDIGGGPIGGALVTVRPDGFGFGQGASTGRTDAQGRFSLWVAPGAVQASAQAPGYAPGSKGGTAPGQTLEILLSPESTLQGRVVEAAGQAPVTGALVTAAGTSQESAEGGGATAFSDTDGRFRITRLPPGRYKATAEAPGRRGEAKESVLLGLGQTSSEVVVEVHRAILVSGRMVIDDAGHGCSDGWVSLSSKANTERYAGAPGDRDGRVVFRAVLPGTYAVHVYCQGRLAEDHYPALVVAERDVEGLIWRVKDGRALRGLVAEKDGTPVPGAQLRAQGRAADPRGQVGWGWDTSGADGRFEMRGLAPGHYSVRVDSPELVDPPAPVEVELPADHDVDDLRITLERGGAIAGDVTDEAGTPVAGARIMAQGSHWSMKGMAGGNVTTRDDGTFTVKGLAAGEYRVQAFGSGFSALRAPGASDDDVPGVRTSVREGVTAEVHLRVETRDATITGRVVDGKGRPVTDAFVDAERESDSAAAAAGGALRNLRWSWDRVPVLTDADGRFAVHGLRRGPHTVHAVRRGGGEAVAEHVAAGASVTLTIAVTGSMAGRVVAADGQPVEAFTLSATDPKSGAARSETFFRTGGAFTLRDLPAGEYRVSVNADEGTGELTVPLGAGEDRTGIGVPLTPRTSLRGRLLGLEDGQPAVGMMMHASPSQGMSFMFGGGGDDEEHKDVTDAEGRFELDAVPSGRVVLTAFPVAWEQSPWGFVRAPARVEAGKMNELPPIKVARRRTARTERGGDLGFRTKEFGPDIEPDAMHWVVAVIRPGGPAAQSGLKVGDEIVAVDGFDVSGPQGYLFYQLAQVPPGTTIKLGLLRGETVSLTAGKPL